MSDWEGYTEAKKDAAINNIMLRDKLGKVLTELEDPLGWADEIGAHPSMVNGITTVREILKGLYSDAAESVHNKQ